MTLPTVAERLGIAPGSLVWLVGDTIEETSLLDPLPEGVLTYEDEPDGEHERPSWQDGTWGEMFGEPPEPRRPHGIDTAVVVVTHAQELHRVLDDSLTRMGSVERIWIVVTPNTLPEPIVVNGTADYGWDVVETLEINETWTARRIAQG